MCKRPSADRPEADGTAAHAHRGASPHQVSAEPPCLWEKRLRNQPPVNTQLNPWRNNQSPGE